MQTLQERVVGLLARRGISKAEAARRGGFGNVQFINDIVKGKKTSVRGDNLSKLALSFDTTEDYLLLKTNNPDLPYAARSGDGFVEALDAPEIDKGLFPRDVPVVGIVACGDDASFILNGQTGDYVRRPPGLQGKRSVYALNVYGDSMYPVYRHGALVYVDPLRTPAVTEDAVLELHPEDPRNGEPGKGYLKRVKALRGRSVICEQFNPPGEIVFDRDEIKSFHRVIPWEEVLGY